MPSNTLFIYLETVRGGAEALPVVWKIAHTQEHSHQNAEGLSLPSAYAVRHRPLRGTSCRQDRKYFDSGDYALSKAGVAPQNTVGTAIPNPEKYASPTLSVILHSSPTASVFLMHHHLRLHIKGVCPYRQQIVQAPREKVRCLNPKVIQRKTRNPMASPTEKTKQHNFEKCSFLSDSVLLLTIPAVALIISVCGSTPCLPCVPPESDVSTALIMPLCSHRNTILLF